MDRIVTFCMSVQFINGRLVQGETGGSCSNTCSIANRSYVCPSIAMTGSFMSSNVIGQQRSLGGAFSGHSSSSQTGAMVADSMLATICNASLIARFFWSIHSVDCLVIFLIVTSFSCVRSKNIFLKLLDLELDLCNIRLTSNFFINLP